MKNTLKAFLLLSTLSSFVAGNELSIRSFRFARHNALDFERLVIEFRGESNHAPAIKMASSGKETQIQMLGVQLVGGIPEAAINESYKGSSKYFGPLAINTDSPDGSVLLRAFTKGHGTKVDAFWLNSPSRLILDVFPEDSERSFGREVVGKERGVASHSSVKKHKSSGHHSGFSADVVCYPAHNQVKPSIGYGKGNGAKGVIMTMEESQNNRGMGDVLCFPANAQVSPTISFQPSEKTVSNLFQGNFDEKPRLFVPNQQALPPKAEVAPEKPAPTAAVPPATSADAFTQEADMFMGMGMDPEPPRAPSASAYDDNFNKNNPPPTLGKTLLPPIEAGGSGERSENQGANPATLLPPLK